MKCKEKEGDTRRCKEWSRWGWPSPGRYCTMPMLRANLLDGLLYWPTNRPIVNLLTSPYFSSSLLLFSSPLLLLLLRSTSFIFTFCPHNRHFPNYLLFFLSTTSGLYRHFGITSAALITESEPRYPLLWKREDTTQHGTDTTCDSNI